MTTAAGTVGIAELARRTGLSQQAIRAWEARFGFPTPRRTQGGRRLYAEGDVDLVRRVLALRDSGVRVAAAVARVRSEEREGLPLSVYAQLRRLHPELESRRLRRDVLVAISHAIEDEAMSRASRPHVFGAFQQERFFRAAAERWREIARTASSCLVYADFAARSGSAGEPVQVPLAPDAPLLREWAVVVAAPAFSVVLTAWEVPGQVLPAARREYESIFSFDPAAVRAAAEVFVAAARASGETDAELLDVLEGIDASLAAEPTPTAGVDGLVVRAFDYLQRLSPSAE